MTNVRFILPLCFSALFSACSDPPPSTEIETDSKSASASPSVAPVTPASVAARAFQAGDVSGSWDCDTDAASRIDKSLPPANSRIADGEKGMAPRPARFEYALASGGPTGMFAKGHLHLIHNDRRGRTNFFGMILVQDQSGYAYAALPPLETHVEGSSRKSSRHLHCTGQFTFSEPLAETINRSVANGGEITLRFVGGRDREDWKNTLRREFKEQLSELTGDPSNIVAVVAALNGAPPGP